jgi:hypothetical protein
MNEFIASETHRGFGLIEFKDDNDRECSIQKSSCAEDHKIWMGCESGTHHNGQCMARMHLTREMATKIVTILNQFIETGYIDG